MALDNPSNVFPTKREHVTWKVLDDETVLLDLDTGVYFTLNTTGTAVWERLDGHTSLTEIARAISEQFDITIGEAQQDLLELTRALLDEGLVKVAQDTTASLGA